MHIFFSGIGGTGLGPLALIAHQAGYTVSGSDKQDSGYISYLRTHGISQIHIGQSHDQLAELHSKNPVDWLVYSSAVAIEQPDAPEFIFCRDDAIRMSKRDDLLQTILDQKKLKMLAIAGTHGKTTTTAMAIWLAKCLGMPASHSVGGKISFGDMGHYEPGSEYFIYEADEYDRNFLTFNPAVSIITGIDWDHADIYPSRQNYEDAFKQFIGQSERAVMWHEDAEKLEYEPRDTIKILQKSSSILNQLTLPGIVNRQDALQVAEAFSLITNESMGTLVQHLNAFPGVSRRFELLAPKLVTDYAHTPPKIRGTLETAHEVGGKNVVVVYEGLHNTRQHFIKDELRNLFEDVKHLYIVPSYLAREDASLALLTPADLKTLMSADVQNKTTPSQLNENLRVAIENHQQAGDLVVCISAGGGGSLDEWLRNQFVGAR